MTITVDRSPHPSVFDAGLPHLDYENAQHPDEAHDHHPQDRVPAPIAIGPHGPELLSYELVAQRLRDVRDSTCPKECSLPPKVLPRSRYGTG